MLPHRRLHFLIKEASKQQTVTVVDFNFPGINWKSFGITTVEGDALYTFK